MNICGADKTDHFGTTFAMYRMMGRADHCEDIFLDEVEPQGLLKTPAEACQTTGWQMHAWARARVAGGHGQGGPC